MKSLLLVLLLGLLPHSVAGQLKTDGPPLESVLPHFELQDATLVDGLSKLSILSVPNLHLGLEEILDNPIDRKSTVKFSLTLDNATVREVLNELCKHDNRYAWAVDGRTVNIYPVATANDNAYLANLHIDHIEFNNITHPEQAVEKLLDVVQNQQLGYAGAGAAATYTNPWTARFENLTVRQYINRIAERVEPNGGWILRGAVDNRFFGFFPRSFK